MDAGSTTDQAEKPESSPYTQKLEDCLLQWNMTVEDFGALNGDLPYPTILQVGRYRDFNYGSISDKVTECKAKVDCNNDTVIVTGYEFTVLFDHTELSQRDQENRRIVSGELTFGRNLLTALHALDVLVVYAHEPSDALFFSRILHPYVKVTFMGSGSTASALDEGNNELLPMEDYSSFPYVRQEKFDTCNALLLSFWGRGPGPPDSPASKFGSFLQFVTPYPRVGNSFLGFTGSEGCSPEIVPFEQRRKAGLIWGKKPSQFANAWSSEAMEAILASGLVDEMLATSVEEDDLPTYLYNHVTNLGLQTTEGFRNLLANSRFLLGLGNPCDGPTFLEALCRGTAFINPGNRKPEGYADSLVYNGTLREALPFRHPSDFMPTFPDGTSLLHIQKRYIAKYYSQHTIAETLGPPYVYHVELNDTRALLGAIAAIHENPPRQSFVPEQYKEENFVERVRKIVRHPWCGWVSDGAARRGAGRAEALFPFA